MHVVALLVAAIVAGGLWSSGQRVWAVVAFLVIASGVWVWPLRWLGGLVGMAVAPPSRRRRAREFRTAAEKFGLWDSASTESLQRTFRAWCKANAAFDVTAEGYLAALLGIDAAWESRTVTLPNGVRVVFTKEGDHVTWRYEGLTGEPHFLLPSLSQERLAEMQLAAGEDPWFPDAAARLANRRASSDQAPDVE